MSDDKERVLEFSHYPDFTKPDRSRHIFPTKLVAYLVAAASIFGGATKARAVILQDAVRNAGQQVSLADFQQWRGDKIAFKELYTMLHREPIAGTDWRNAIDAVAIVAGGDPELGEKALADLKEFAQDTHYFGSRDQLPGAPVISEAAAAAKAEVPYALAMLAESASLQKGSEIIGPEKVQKFHDLHLGTIHVLKQAQSPMFWNVEWTNEAYSGAILLARHSAQALARLFPAPSR